MRLIDAAAAEDPDFGAYLHVAAMTGARRGELCALQWRDIDDTTQAVVIRRNVVEGARGALVIKDTKTHAARRVALDPTTEALLAAHRERWLDRAAAAGKSLRPDAFLFSSAITGDIPWIPNEVTKRFIRLRNKVGVDKVRLHDLRHFAATRLLAAGVPVRTVSGRLGHANAATTLGVYAHFVESSDRDAAAKLEALLASSRPTHSEPVS
jgi:integrase